MSKRDVIQEILDRRSRQMQSDAYSIAMSRLQTLMNMYEAEHFKLFLKDTATNELFEHVPVVCVAVLQNYLSDTIANLLNLEDNDTYRNNARNLKTISFGIDAVLAIGGKTITVGEFISHNLRFNSINDIDRLMSEILGFPVFKSIKELEAKGYKPVDFGNLDEMYKTRHIVCHEYGMTLELTNHQAFNYLANTMALILSFEMVFLTS